MSTEANILASSCGKSRLFRLGPAVGQRMFATEFDRKLTPHAVEPIHDLLRFGWKAIQIAICRGELPAELGRRRERLERIADAKRALEARVRARAEAEQKQKHKDSDNKLGSGSVGKRRPAVQPQSKTQHNFTDPESRIMKGPDGFVQAYNAQAAVEPALQLIVG